MRCLALSFAPIDCNHEFMLGLTSPEGDRGARLAAEPSYGSIDFAARCGTSQLFEPPQTALIELKRLLARQRRQLVDDCAHIKNRSEYKEASSNVARKHILRLRLRPATAQSRSETLRREVEISAERL